MRASTIVLSASCVLALAGCGVGAGVSSGDGQSQVIDQTRATWQVLDLENGAITPHGSAPDLLGDAAYRDRLLAFRLVPAGTAPLGSGDFARQADEVAAAAAVPAVYLAAGELTRAQWKRLAGAASTPWTALLPAALTGSDGGDDRPAAGLSPDAIRAALAAWNQVHGAHLALPSAAQWEAAARAGSAASQPWGEDHSLATVRRYAVTWETAAAVSAPGPRALGDRLPNALGLYDLCGNLWEVVAASGGVDSARGGSWADPIAQARPANRLLLDPAEALATVGVRLAFLP